jgi:hypothetical protein
MRMLRGVPIRILARPFSPPPFSTPLPSSSFPLREGRGPARMIETRGLFTQEAQRMSKALHPFLSVYLRDANCTPMLTS